MWLKKIVICNPFFKQNNKLVMHKENYSLRLKEIKKILKQQKINHFILPNSDEFFLEYLPESEKRIQFVSGFAGSSATIVFGQNKSNFFTDGRYILQAQQEINSDDYNILNIADTSLFAWIEDNIKKSEIIAIDAKLFSMNFVKKLQKLVDEKLAKLFFIEQNPVDKIWKDRPKTAESKIFPHNLIYSGESSLAKRKKIISDLNADAIIFNQPESICWLLNIRASDVEYAPLLAAYAILFKDGKVDLFVDKKRVSSKIKDINFIQTNCVESTISSLAKKIKSVQIDPAATNFWFYKLISDKIKIVEKQDPALILKACKNKIEVEGAIKSHQIDGLALTKFLYWLEKNQGKIDELQAEDKLLEMRKQHPDFLYPSFRSISSFAANGAIIHYHSSPKTNKKITGNSLYLIDSGGQYPQGTTDVTRTVAIGKPTAQMIEDFTLVLKGHIAIAQAKFPQGTMGSQLDVLARSPLWQAGKDYDHGTGHGVGSFLSVHEGPCSISKRQSCQLKAGMLLSNEPGFYKTGEYGIRIENLMLVENAIKSSEKQNKDAANKLMLSFRTITLAPIDYRLVNFKILSDFEKKWLKNYHKKVFDAHKNNLNSGEKAWLARFLDIYKKVVDKEDY